MDKVIDEIYFLNNDPETRLKIRLQEKAALDSKLALDYLTNEAKKNAHIEGYAEGHAEGRAEGHAEGRAEGRAEGHAEGRAEGHAEGRAEGRAEGHAEGVLEEKFKIAKNLKKNNVPNDIIIITTGLSKEEVEKL